MYPFERFTDAAKHVLSTAQKEAEAAGHSYIGTEHLLLGLIGVQEGAAARALESLGVKLESARAAIAAVLGGHERILLSQITPTARVKRVIELAFDEAQRIGSAHVGTAQLLLGMIAEGEGVAAPVLRDLGVDHERAAGALEEVGPQEAASSSSVPPLTTAPVGTGARVLVHDPDPPYRLWEGRVSGAGPAALEVTVPGHPAGERRMVEANLVHTVPGGPTFLCRYCSGAPHL